MWLQIQLTIALLLVEGCWEAAVAADIWWTAGLLDAEVLAVAASKAWHVSGWPSNGWATLLDTEASPFAPDLTSSMGLPLVTASASAAGISAAESTIWFGSTPMRAL